MAASDDEDFGSAKTGSPTAPDPTASTRAQEGRTPSQRKLRDDVKGALFDDKPLPGPAKLEVGVVLGGRYRLISLLGAGGMGEVYRAHDLVLDEEVALKFLPDRYASDANLMERFVNEVRIARQITHPNACRVHDIAEADGRSILSMEYIDGEDLASLLRRIGRLPEEKALELAQQLCSGLAALHEQGMLHRDLKPANVMVDGKGRLKICDFGLAAVEGDLTKQEIGDGTPAYMAPEQARGEAVSVQSDIYALGLVLFELISGKHALTGDASGTAVAKGTRTAVGELSSHVRGIAPEVDAILKQCLEADPDERPGSVLEVAAALPGGDPLAVAAAAGRAPSVEMVARAKSRGAFSGRVGWSLVAATVALVCTFGLLSSQFSRLSLGTADLPPDVLEHRARDLLEQVGATAGVDSFRRYRPDRLAVSAEREPEKWALGDGFAASTLFEYREHPVAMISLWEPVSMSQPGYDEPGAARVILTSEGTLRHLRIVPPAIAPGSGADYDWTALLDAAGIDPDALQPVEPDATPYDFSDRRWAWTGRKGGVDVRVEGAALDGQLTSFTVLFPWDLAARTEESRSGMVGGPLLYPVLALLGLALVALILLARRLWRRGEADPRSAVRVSIALTLTMAVAFVVGGHAAGVGGFLASIVVALRGVVTVAIMAFVIYVVVEPYGRRFVPRAMTSWARFMRGSFRDPLVARDVLIGVTVGSALAVTSLARLVPLTAAVDLPGDLNVLLGPRMAISATLNAVWAAVLGVLQSYGLYVLIRLLVRGPKRAAVAYVLLWTAAISFPDPFRGDLTQGIVVGLLGFVIAIALLLLITRVGLLATVVMQFTISILFSFPVTSDMSAWYATIGFPAVAAIAVLVAYGVRFGVRHEQ